MNIKQLPLYDIEIDENDETIGMHLISIVDNPAIEANAIFLSSEVLLSANSEKQYITGPVAIPGKKIYRYNDVNFEHYIRFTKEIIVKMRNLFFKNGETKLSNIDHQADKAIEAILIESWIVDDPKHDKSFTLGLKGIVPGTMMVTYHIPNPNDWQIVKSKKGFSLEGIFNQIAVKLVSQELQEPTLEQMIDAITFTLEKYVSH